MTEGVMRHSNVSLESGFTYLWTLLMVAMVGLSLTLAVDVYSTSVQRDKEKELLAIGRQFSRAIGQYYEANPIALGVAEKKDYPGSIEDLLQDNRSLSVRRYLRKVFVDPMTGKAEWGEIRIAGRLVGIHSLSNQHPIKQAFSEVDEFQFNSKTKYSEWIFTYPIDLMSQTSNTTASATSDNNVGAIKQDAMKE